MPSHTRLTTRAKSAASALANFSENGEKKKDEAERGEEEEDNGREKKRARKDGDNGSVSNFSGSLLVLTVSPGRLGLSLKVAPKGGARVVNIYEKKLRPRLAY